MGWLKRKPKGTPKPIWWVLLRRATHLQGQTMFLRPHSVVLDEIRSHYFETMVEAILSWHLQENHQKRGFLNGGAKWTSQPSTLGNGSWLHFRVRFFSGCDFGDSHGFLLLPRSHSIARGRRWKTTCLSASCSRRAPGLLPLWFQVSGEGQSFTCRLPDVMTKNPRNLGFATCFSGLVN